jgi:hypothetical protein
MPRHEYSNSSCLFSEPIKTEVSKVKVAMDALNKMFSCGNIGFDELQMENRAYIDKDLANSSAEISGRKLAIRALNRTVSPL